MCLWKVTFLLEASDSLEAGDSKGYQFHTIVRIIKK